jgi:hypothetical protein
MLARRPAPTFARRRRSYAPKTEARRAIVVRFGPHWTFHPQDTTPTRVNQGESEMIRSTLTLCLLLAVPTAHGATFAPTRFDDPAPNGCLATDCSLREAVIAANATTAQDTILLLPGTYTLSRACAESAQCLDLDITQPLKVIGQSAAGTTIVNAVPWFSNPLDPVASDRRETRVIDIATTGAVTLERLTLRAGAVRGSVGSGANGGCLRSVGSLLTLTDARITECETTIAGSGGGLASVGGQITLTGVKIDFNDAATDGGGIHASGTRISGSAVDVSDNVASGRGGGISTDGQSLWLSGGSKVARNAASIGGGIDRWLRADQVNLLGAASAAPAERLVVEDNVASLMGGGIHARRTSCTSVSNCTAPGAVFRNLIVRRNEAGSSGGGMHLFVEGSGQNTLTISDASFSANVSNLHAGGLYLNVSTAMNSVAERLSFWDNVAATHGGGVYHEGGTVLRHVSSTRNIAQQGASLHFAAGSDPVPPRIEHWTTHAEGPVAVFLGRPVQFQASAFDGVCSGNAIDLGFNFKRNDVGGTCPGTGVASAQMGMSFISSPGNQPVVAINLGSILRNAAPMATNGTRDARGYLRQGMADVGAFEFDGVP